MNRRAFMRTGLAAPAVLGAAARRRPNILFCLADNHSWPHVSANGNKAFTTPNFDRVAGEGVRFTNAYCCAPSCAPSRGGILTGQDIWRLEEGGNLWGTLPAKFPIFTDLLETAGYEIGFTGKGYAPASLEAGGRKRNPAGPQYKSFESFLRARPGDKPFCFWFGGFDTERGAKRAETPPVNPRDVEVPPFLPDNDIVRNDFVEYFKNVQRFDADLGRQLALLEKAGMLENTLVVAAADNGMFAPRCYPNLYDYGTREYLAMRWGAGIRGGRVVDDFVKFSDLAPTFLEAAGLKPSEGMNGRSLMPLLTSGRSGRVERDRDYVVTARERHDWCRAGGVGYPARAIRTAEHLFIRNYESDRWPAGDPDRETFREGVYGDIDRSATKTFMMEHREDPKVKPLFKLAFLKRPGEELYDLAKDPYQMNNVASERQYAMVKRQLSERLTAHLARSGDPRALGRKVMWDDYPYYGEKRFER